MADLQTAEILQHLKNLEQQNFRHRLSGLGQGNLRTGIGLDLDELPAIVMCDERRNIVRRAT
jgi:hypothetical protein